MGIDLIVKGFELNGYETFLTKIDSGRNKLDGNGWRPIVCRLLTTITSLFRLYILVMH